MQKSASQIVLKPSPKSIKTTPKPENDDSKRTTTSELKSKETNPTLIEFQSEEAQLPDWRLQLKNAVLKRKGEVSKNGDTSEVSNTIALASVNEGSNDNVNAIKAEIIEEIQPSDYDNQQLANALKRIERSRKKFYVVEPEVEKVKTENKTEESTKPSKEFPFTIATRNDNPQADAKNELKDSVNFPAKPKLVPQPKTHPNGDLYVTSELDPEFVSAKISSSFENRTSDKRTQEDTEAKKEEVADAKVITEKKVVTQNAELDDAAPFALRFNAGLFDIIIGSLSSMFLLAPFMLLGGEWLSVTGGFAFLATTAIVMFIYMTTTIGLFGKTFGMHLFAIEIIDYFDDEYPTFHQAAVSSSIYLLSLAVFGLGFITSLFDEDKRAVHDLVSGTVVVKEI